MNTLWKKHWSHFAMIIMVTFTLACEESELHSDKAEIEITAEQAADEVAAALNAEINGMVMSIPALGTRIISNASRKASYCGLVVDSTVTTSYTGPYANWNFVTDYVLSLSCNGIIPDTISLSFTSNGTRDGIYYKTQGQTTGKFYTSALKLLMGSTQEIYIHGEATRVGATILKSTEEQQFSSTTTLTVDSLTVDKINGTILGGSANVVFVGISASERTYTYLAEVIFSDNGHAAITINDTFVFDLNIYNGQIIAQEE